jgi:hypothetical protein
MVNVRLAVSGRVESTTAWVAVVNPSLATDTSYEPGFRFSKR